MCDNQTNRSRGISDNTAFTAACLLLQTMSISSSRRYRNTRDSNTVKRNRVVLLFRHSITFMSVFPHSNYT
ncbi:hypothetical protein C0J52_28201 [Blattella germanica]|nr:hypothetical protein C0J52_28201 [Blattella germanica]